MAEQPIKASKTGDNFYRPIIKQTFESQQTESLSTKNNIQILPAKSKAVKNKVE